MTKSLKKQIEDLSEEQISSHLKKLFLEIEKIKDASDYWSLIDLILQKLQVTFWDEDHCIMEKKLFSLENAKYIRCSSKEESYFIFKIYESFSCITDGFDFDYPQSGDWAYSEAFEKWFWL